MAHDNAHPLAGKDVTLTATDPVRGMVVEGARFVVEDWWDRLTGGSWMNAEGNPAALQYAMRSGFNGLPADDEVVYGKIGAFGHLVHVSELGASE
jgi:hypothetical protein